MGYSYKFIDNTVYGAEDINSVLSELATSGIADVFFDGTSYNTSDLNKIAEAITSGGVQYASSDSCKAVKYSSGYIKVLKGTAFFSDGSLIKIDDEGVVLPYVKGQKNYVYLKGNISSENKNEVCCSLVQEVGDIVRIATVDEDENIIDTREFCRGKTAGYQSTFSQPKKISFTYSLIGPSGTYQDFTHDMEGYGYSHIIDISEKEERMAGRAGKFSMSVYDIANNYSTTICYRNNGLKILNEYSNRVLLAGSGGSLLKDADVWAYFTVEGSILKTHVLLSNTETTDYNHTGNVTLLIV